MKHTAKLIYAVSFLILIANLYVFVNRKDYSYKKQVSYNELYQPFAGKGLHHFAVSNDTATIALTGYKSNLAWELKIDSVSAGILKAPFTVTLKEDLHQYTFSPADSTIQPIILHIDYSLKKTYEAAGNSANTNTALRYSSIPFITENKNWNDNYSYVPAAEIQQSKKLLKEEALVNELDTDTVKFKKIARFVYQSLKDHSGIPPDSLFEKTPQQQFDCIRKGKADVWCSNFSMLLNYFCTISGLKIRRIGFMGNTGKTNTGSHAANEIYIAEYGGWIYTDLTNNMIFVKDKWGNYLNTADLLFMKSQQVTPDLFTYRITGDSTIYEMIQKPELLYGHKETELIFAHDFNPATYYALSNKVKRYFTEQKELEFYTNHKHYSNEKFYLKRYLFFSLVVALVLSGSAFILNKKIK